MKTAKNLTRKTLWMPESEANNFRTLIESKFGNKVAISFRSKDGWTKNGSKYVHWCPGHIYAVLNVQNCGLLEQVRVFNALSEISQVH